ncbi:MAG: thioredoxin domain-containing protein [Gammaproteobacteria bacterium]|nr:thioredoxin domain-containing protein [Gammaproteobacteria bacterium]
MTTKPFSKNTLYKESSPYLLQHANNPVHWQPWNKASLEQARKQNKPILLSIGYSACHWCHVMAHESFDDQQTADVMNELFINIKVDKEERPDLDKIYQNTHSLLTERAGGWPLTVFITPDTHMPIFVGTYFPKIEKHGLPTFTSLLHQISNIWLTRQSDITQQSLSLQATYQKIYEATKPDVNKNSSSLNLAVIDIARHQVEKQFDPVNGGFSGTPKFPHPATIEFAIKHWCYTHNHDQPDSRILHCALYTLSKMANGGIFDHLGGGFCRYSTDESWMIPHFEKMLYDNGPLLSLYSQAWKLNSDQVFFNTACETANWAMREMQACDGGYYSSQDADSEGTEGKFFVWPHDEIKLSLEKLQKNNNISIAAIDIFKKRFGLNLSSNFENYWHLHGYIDEALLIKEVADTQNKDLRQQLFDIRRHLFQQREQRIHPETDTKVLCAWNGLMIQGMAVAGRLLNKHEFTESATRAAYFLKNNCWKDKQLFATYSDGKARLHAYLDDYAFLVYGLLELLQNKWDDELYRWTLALADKLLDDFEDTNYGGFFFTSHHHEALIQRLKNVNDDAIPAGNAIAALTLNRLGYLSGNQRYIHAAENCLKSACSSINRTPISHCAMLNALNEYLLPPNILIIRSSTDNIADSEHWASLTQQHYLPNTLIYNIPADQPPHPTLSNKVAGDTDCAYPCSGMRCDEPIKNISELRAYLLKNSYSVNNKQPRVPT